MAKVFEDLEFIPYGAGNWRAALKFENGLYISVLTGPIAIADESRPYEAALLGQDGEYVNNTIRTCLTAEDVTAFMKEIQEMSL